MAVVHEHHRGGVGEVSQVNKTKPRLTAGTPAGEANRRPKTSHRNDRWFVRGVK
jgi:hypothetical protein